MKSEKLFYNELRFLEKEYNFEFIRETKGIDEFYIFKKDSFELGFLYRINQFEYICRFYFSNNERETIINIDDEFYKMFGTKSRKNYFWQLGMIVKEQLKDNKIFNYNIT